MLPQLLKEAKVILNPEEFFSALGELHDADLESFEWKVSTKELIIEIDDLYSNFFQTSEYPGKLSARFVASELQSLEMDVIVPIINPIRILRFHVTQSHETAKIVSAFSFGEGSIKFECQKLVGMIR